MSSAIAVGEKAHAVTQSTPSLITKVLVRADVPDTMNQGIRSSGQFGTVDLSLARQEHALYKDAIRKVGGNLGEIPKSKHPDSLYVQDTAYVIAGPKTNWTPVAIIANPGNPERRKEVAEIKDYLAQIMPVVEIAKGSYAYIEFGDVERVGNTVIVGLSGRTNLLGAELFQHLAKEVDPTLSFVNIPVSGVLHWSTGITALTDQVLIKSPHMVADTSVLKDKTVVTFPEAEAYSANALKVNGGVVIAEGFKLVDYLAHKHYPAEHVQAVPTSQTQLLNGSLTCASIVWKEAARPQ